MLLGHELMMYAKNHYEIFFSPNFFLVIYSISKFGLTMEMGILLMNYKIH